ncbi:recombinase family protein [Streptomyces sp. NPDC048197]|uniref:recombinase family protein n=1 Tax=Streptomyces sp. NPDC048197 TaxID=3365511 RepID=UPI003714EE81
MEERTLHYATPSRAQLLRFLDEIEPRGREVPAAFRGIDPDELEPFIGYIRVSSWNEEKISPELQKTAIRDWARTNRKRVIGWISDLDATGRNFRRKIMKGIEAVEARIAAGIGVWRYSRFGRNRTGNAINLARLEDVGGRLESATEPVDAGTAIGRFQRGMILELSAFESDRAGEQWTEVHAHRLGLLLPSAGRPRFGYIWHPRRVPDPEEPGGWRVQKEWYEPNTKLAPLFPELYLGYIDGTGFIDLARYLNDLGHRTTRGNPWRQDSLLRYMDSGFPAGLLQVRDSCDCPKNKKSSCRHWRHFRGAHDPVINWEIERDAEELWAEYREKRAKVAKMPPRARTATYDTTGLVRCALCRGAMTGHPNGNGAVYWRCAKADAGGDCTGVSATYGDLLELVQKFLVKVANGIDTAPPTEAPALPQPAAPDPAKMRAELSAELDSIKAALKRLVKDYALHPDRYPDESYDEARGELTEDRDKVLAQLAELEEEAEPEEALPMQEDFRPMVVGVLPEWATFSPKHRNGILQQLMRHILVSPRPSRYETLARVVPIFEREETMWTPAVREGDPVQPGGTLAHEPSATLEDMPDGIAWSIAD